MTNSSARPPAIAARHPVLVIGIPCFNEERFLQRAIDSLKSQTCTDFAVLISDNASTDRTGEIGQRAAAEDLRFIYIRQPANIGGAANFDFTRRASDSPFLMWLGAHDYVAPTFLERLLPAMLEDSRWSVSYCNTVFVDDADQTLWTAASKDLDRHSETPLKRYVMAPRRISSCTEINNIIRRDMLAEQFENVWGTDMIMLADLAYQGPFHHVAEPLYFARQVPETTRPEGYMKRLTGRDDQHEDKRRFVRLLAQRAKSLGKPGWRTWLAAQAVRALAEQRYLPTREIGSAALLLRIFLGLRQRLTPSAGTSSRA